jgi:hypothetical protein
MWCACRHHPFNIVADPELLDLFKMLYSRVEVPHPTTVSRDVREIHRLCKDRVANLLEVILTVISLFGSLICHQDYPGRIHIGVDGWTSPNVFSFLGITVHRAVDNQIQAFTLDFIK